MPYLARRSFAVGIASMLAIPLEVVNAQHSPLALTQFKSVVEAWPEGILHARLTLRTGEALETSNQRANAKSFAVASLSKAVTGLGVAVLIREGKLSLDSQIGEFLEPVFAKRNQRLHESIKPLTIRRLLTHTAGLRPNFSTDPATGIDNSLVFRRIFRGADYFDYLIAADAAKSTGASTFVYSNISYLLLGLLIEAAGGQDYEAFCINRVLSPAGIKDGKISEKERYRQLAPFAGWQLTLEDVTKVWSQFDPEHSVLLNAESIQELVRTPLAAPISSDGRTHYAFGNYIRRNANATAFVLSHNGLSNFFRDQPAYEFFVETYSSGPTIVIGSSPVLGGEKRRQLMAHLRTSVGL